jgi:hypothetical protein
MKSAPEAISFGWLDLGEDDQRRAKEYLSQFNADNTLDELGFGVLRDAFADVFFPATNTIMTRTRYLVFIPALCLAVESEELTGNAAAVRLTQLENKLRESLHVEESVGVVGERAKDSLSRYPSSIYWNSLRRLGIFCHPTWGLAYYQAHLADFYASTQAERDDDGNSHLNVLNRRCWDKEYCDMLTDGRSIVFGNEGVPATLNFSLTVCEARYLRARFKAADLRSGRPSILGHLLEQEHANPFGYPWDVDSPPQLAPYVRHARCFSMLTRGATLQYFHLLQRERDVRGIAKSTCDFGDIFSSWWEATRQELADWEVDEFLMLASSVNGLRRPNDSVFIKSWRKLVVEANNAHGLLENAEAHALIRQRERITRPSKSRLFHAEYLARWKPIESAEIEKSATDPNKLCFWFDYRAWIGSTFVCDIVAGLAAEE